MNTKLRAICANQGCPLNLFVTAGQVSDYIGARALLGSLPRGDWLLGDRGYQADWFRDVLHDKENAPAFPGGSRARPRSDTTSAGSSAATGSLMFGRLKHWRRVTTRYDRCLKLLLSAIALAATVIH